jgi:hypothetical protein
VVEATDGENPHNYHAAHPEGGSEVHSGVFRSSYLSPQTSLKRNEAFGKPRLNNEVSAECAEPGTTVLLKGGGLAAFKGSQKPRPPALAAPSG